MKKSRKMLLMGLGGIVTIAPFSTVISATPSSAEKQDKKQELEEIAKVLQITNINSYKDKPKSIGEGFIINPKQYSWDDPTYTYDIYLDSAYDWNTDTGDVLLFGLNRDTGESTRFKIDSFFVSEINVLTGKLKVKFKLRSIDEGYEDVTTDTWQERDISDINGITWNSYLDAIISDTDGYGIIPRDNAAKIDADYSPETKLPSSVDVNELFKKTHISDSMLSYWVKFARGEKASHNDKDGTYSIKIFPELFAPSNFSAENIENPLDPTKTVINKLKWINWADNNFNKISYTQSTFDGPKTFTTEHDNHKPSDYTSSKGYVITLNGFKTEGQRLNEQLPNIGPFKLKDHTISNTNPASDNTIDRVNWITYEDAKQDNLYSQSNNPDSGSIFDWHKTEDDNNRTITITYDLKSTRQTEGGFTGDVTSKQVTITLKFPPAGTPVIYRQTRSEQDEINSLDANFTADPEKLASYFDLTDDSKKPQGTVTADSTNKYTRTVEVKSISGYNDADGKLKLKYVIKSVKNDTSSETFESTEKEIEIPGYLTEANRIKKLKEKIKNQTDLFTYNGGKKKDKLPSDLSISDFTAKNLDAENAELKITQLRPDNQSGNVSLDYALKTKKTADDLYHSTYSSESNKVDPSTIKEDSNINDSGYKTNRDLEKERLNNLAITLDYPDKSTIMPSTLTSSDQDKVTYDHSQLSDVNVVIDSIQSKEDRYGSVDVKYHFVSTKNGMTDIVSSTKTQTILGFKTEKQRLNELSVNLDYPNKDQILATNANKDDLTKDPNTYDNASLVIDSIENQNNQEGSLVVKYHFVSTKPFLQDIISTYREQTIQGFKKLDPNDFDVDAVTPNFESNHNQLPSYFDLSSSDKTPAYRLEQDPQSKYTTTVEIQEVADQNDKDGTLKVKYIIKATSKEDPSKVLTSSQKEATVSGYKTEFERLNEMDVTFDYPDKNLISPNKAIDDSITWSGNGSDSTVQIVSDSLLKDDATGTISGQYTITSTKNGMEDVFVTKNFVIRGFLDESTRLNNLIDNQDVSKSISYDDPNVPQETIKASWFMQNPNWQNLVRKLVLTPGGLQNKSEIIILDNPTPDDDEGTLAVRYKLTSTKSELENSPEEDKTSTKIGVLKIWDFLTNLQERKNLLIDDLNREKEEYKNNQPGLTEEQAEKFINLVNDEATDTIPKVDRIQTQATIRIIKNEAEKLIFLNPKQRNEMNDAFSKKNLTLQEAEKIYHDFSTINSKMKILKDGVKEYEDLIADPNNAKYQEAEPLSKKNFDDNFAFAKELLTSDKFDGKNLDPLQNGQRPYNTLDTLISSETAERSLAFDYANLHPNREEQNPPAEESEEAKEFINKLVIDANGIHKLTNKEIKEILAEFDKLGVNNPNYIELADEMIRFNNLRDLLKQYRDSSVDNPDFDSLEKELIKLSISQEPYVYNKSNVITAWRRLFSDLMELQDQATYEVNLVHSLLNNNFDSFISETNLAKPINRNRYSEFKTELLNNNYFNLMNKESKNLSSKEKTALQNIQKKDASNVLYSALFRHYLGQRPLERLSFWWWVVLTLITLGIFDLIYLLYSKIQKRK
ncbi:lipoprotein 17-related variable surface protein [Mycoplasmopsis gallinacea]|uniref:Lipoprotein-associated type-17 domain-containing protein n=1 Tax=Mycoplasmopsis gallinacea TaxID=29556 RepID=A0A6H0V507_9BACT|nr:lipoprotein 17-related variable surface protein [Mycoplasmopsis gallinacea]QIW62556.1 hypothetical protein GOQ20_04010 [Mycoplasmopsis gallinacea]